MLTNILSAALQLGALLHIRKELISLSGDYVYYI